jgi:hypothetical protein
MFGKKIVISDPLLYCCLPHPLFSPKTTKEYPESNEYNWSTEFEGI